MKTRGKHFLKVRDSGASLTEKKWLWPMNTLAGICVNMENTDTVEIVKSSFLLKYNKLKLALKFNNIIMWRGEASFFYNALF